MEGIWSVELTFVLHCRDLPMDCATARSGSKEQQAIATIIQLDDTTAIFILSNHGVKSKDGRVGG